ncbi:MAG: hypothetical protein ACXVFQ_21090 [Solirubrobacteraceae bacterium]
MDERERLMPRIPSGLKSNAIAYLALFVALGGTSYAAINLPAGSVGTRELRNHAITPAKLNPTSVAASVRTWATLQWFGAWRIKSSSSDIHVANIAAGEVVTWQHTRFPRNCMASVTPIRNFPVEPGTVSPYGFVTTVFDGPAGRLEIDALAPSGVPQLQSVNVLIVCPSPGSQKLNK